MKKLLVLAFALLLLCSCRSQPDETLAVPYIKRDPSIKMNTHSGLTTDGSNIYFTAIVGSDTAQLSYSPQTNTYSRLCNDPLCDHKSSCYISHIRTDSEFIFHQNYAYFYHFDLTYKAKDPNANPSVNFIRYDLINNQYRLYQTIEGYKLHTKLNCLYAGDYRYYYDMVDVSETTEADTDSFEYSLIRQNLYNRNTETVYTGVYIAEDYFTPLVAVPGKVFFKLPTSIEVRDEQSLDVLKKIDIVFGNATYDGTYIYGTAWKQDSEETYLYRMNPDTYAIEEFTIPGRLSTYWLGDNYIYYTCANKLKIEAEKATREVTDPTVYKLSKASLDSGTPDIKMLATFDGAFEKTYIEDNALVELDGALYGFYGTFNENVHEFESGSDGFSSTRNGCDFLIRIDCETGEISIVEGTVR